jgi:rare lipoprotein A (peptidoglycan hydrolase)
VAAWAVARGLFLVLVASATSRGDTGGAALGGGAETGGTPVTQPRPQANQPRPEVRGEARSATWYGPGFYGRRTACGVVLRRSTEGVAHRRLPCGTLVTFNFRGRSRTVPVIDRGPFARGVHWDLTAATARALGLRQTAAVRASF